MKGIYAYYDLHNNYYVYVGKDSNIAHNRRHHQHKQFSGYDEQPINRVVQNNPERYEYHRLIELPEDISDNFLNDLEVYFIDLFKTYVYENIDKHVFNFTKGGDGISGYKHSDEERKKMSEALSGENHPMYGKNHSEETRRKMSEALSGEKHPLYGKHHTEETRKKISENHADVSGENNPRAKYSLWDITFVNYHKNDMFKNNREPNPCKCFKLKYNGKDFPIGGFIDFLSVEIIVDLIKKEVIENG